MTVSSSTSKSGPYACNGSTVLFVVGFAVTTQTDLQVIRTDPSNSDLVLTLSTDYSVSLNSDQVGSPGGTITLTSAPASGYQITILRNVSITQGASLPNGGGWYPKVVENALDKLTMVTQQLAEKQGRSVMVGVSQSDPTALVATIFSNVSASAASAAAAASSATAAAGSATTAAGSATTAAGSATTAAGSATAAAGSATAAAVSATAASGSATAAAASAAAAAAGFPSNTVTGTTQVCAVNNAYILTNVAATACTAPATPANFDLFRVLPGNGLLTNTIDFGAATVRGPASDVTGVLTLNPAVALTFMYSTTLLKWVVL